MAKIREISSIEHGLAEAIKNLKEAYNLKDKINLSNQIRNLEEQYPQLAEFLKNNQSIFEKYFEGDNLPDENKSF